MKATETRTADSKGRVTLPRGFANTPIIIEQISETELRIRKAVIIPRDELPFYEESAQPLSDQDRDRFLELLDHPPRPNRALQKAARVGSRHDPVAD